MKGYYEVSYIRARAEDSMERSIAAESPKEAVCLLYAQLAGQSGDIQAIAKSTEILSVKFLGAIDDSNTFIPDCRIIPEDGTPHPFSAAIVSDIKSCFD